MQAFEFYTTTSDGFIRIPDEYAGKIPAKVKVIVLADEKARPDKSSLFPDFSVDTTDFAFNRDEVNER